MIPRNEAASVDSTGVAEIIEFTATLTWRRSEDIPSTSILASWSDSGGARLSLKETDHVARATRTVSGVIFGSDESRMDVALDDAVRAVNNLAALTGAIVELRVIRSTGTHASAPDV